MLPGAALNIFHSQFFDELILLFSFNVPFLFSLLYKRTDFKT